MSLVQMATIFMLICSDLLSDYTLAGKISLCNIAQCGLVTFSSDHVTCIYNLIMLKLITLFNAAQCR